MFSIWVQREDWLKARGFSQCGRWWLIQTSSHITSDPPLCLGTVESTRGLAAWPANSGSAGSNTATAHFLSSSFLFHCLSFHCFYCQFLLILCPGNIPQHKQAYERRSILFPHIFYRGLFVAVLGEWFKVCSADGLIWLISSTFFAASTVDSSIMMRGPTNGSFYQKQL